jgi:hypothetical protein
MLLFFKPTKFFHHKKYLNQDVFIIWDFILLNDYFYRRIAEDLFGSLLAAAGLN